MRSDWDGMGVGVIKGGGGCGGMVMVVVCGDGRGGEGGVGEGIGSQGGGWMRCLDGMDSRANAGWIGVDEWVRRNG